MLDKSEALHQVAQTEVAARVIAAGVGASKIVAGNYSVLMACLHDILTHTVTVAPDGVAHPGSSPIHLIVEPMWLDSVSTDYNNELWGQSIDAFPLPVQHFAKAHIKPPPEVGHKLTWGQVRDLRSAMLDRIKNTPGFHVYEGQIQQVEDNGEALKILLFSQEKLQEITVPCTGEAIVLDCSQRPRLAGPVLADDPTILYQRSRTDNARLAHVPIFTAGAGAQAAWVLDKMGKQREYSIGYNSTLDFRIANAILGHQQFTAADGNVKINNPDLAKALEKYRDGGTYTITYTRDNQMPLEVSVSLYPNKTVKLIPTALLPVDPIIAKAFLNRLGVKEGDLEAVLTKINQQIQEYERLGLNKNQMSIKLMIDPPTDPCVGIAVNATGWVALKDSVSSPKPPFWGRRAQVITGEELVSKAKLVTPGSLLPGSGIPRMLAMKSTVREMRTIAEDGLAYDVRALAFTELEFEKMCYDCHFSLAFSTVLKTAIQQLNTPEKATPDPVTWIIHQYEVWLKSQPSKASSNVEDVNESDVQQARIALMNSVKQHTNAEWFAIKNVTLMPPILGSREPLADKLHQDQLDAGIIGLALPIEHDDDDGGLGQRISLRM